MKRRRLRVRGRVYLRTKALAIGENLTGKPLEANSDIDHLKLISFVKRKQCPVPLLQKTAPSGWLAQDSFQTISDDRMIVYYKGSFHRWLICPPPDCCIAGYYS